MNHAQFLEVLEYLVEQLVVPSQLAGDGIEQRLRLRDLLLEVLLFPGEFSPLVLMHLVAAQPVGKLGMLLLYIPQYVYGGRALSGR